MREALSPSRQEISRKTFFLLIVAGSLARALTTLRGHNFDIESYRIVADIVSTGGNVYAETTRYNYGPIWFNILGLLNTCFGWIESDILRIRMATTFFLTCIDILTALYLGMTFSRWTALLFFLNPISIIISGYHGQFDNFAVLVGLVSIHAYQASQSGPSKAASLCLLGISLSIKHVFAVLPLWIFFHEKRLREKLIALMIPIATFILLFLPYSGLGMQGIKDNVFGYSSFNNAPLWSAIAPNLLHSLIPAESYKIYFLSFIAILGYLLRKRPLRETSYLYLIAFVAFSSAITNQYLAICITAIAAYWNPLFAAYSIIGALFLSIEDSGLHIALLPRLTGWRGQYAYELLVILLALGLAYTIAGRTQSLKFLARIKLKTISFFRAGI